MILLQMHNLNVCIAWMLILLNTYSFLRGFEVELLWRIRCYDIVM